MLINKIEKLGNNKYKIIIGDEKLVTYDNVILKYNLLYKKNIDLNLYEEIIKESKYYELYNIVVNYILKRRRSKKEIEKYILKYGLDEKLNNKLIDELIKNNLLNDKELCKAYINDNIFLGKKGVNKIKLELINKGISIDIIERYLDKVDKSLIIEKLEKIIKKKINSNKKYSNNYLKQKILNEMVIMGYNKKDILEILEKEIKNIDDVEIIRKNYIKLKNNLAKKYFGDELKAKLKVGLLTKGFSIHEINEIIRKTED